MSEDQDVYWWWIKILYYSDRMLFHATKVAKIKYLVLLDIRPVMAHHESCLLVDCSRCMGTELQKYDGTSCRTWWHNSKPSEIPAVILSHVVVSYWSHFLDPWMSYCLLQTLLLGAVLFFFKLVNQLMLAEVPLQLKPS